MKSYNPVGRFEIYVTDMNRAQTFYQAVFQKGEWKDLSNTEAQMEMLAFPRDDSAGGAAGALVKMPDHGPSQLGTIIYFSCVDCAIEASRVEAAGGNVTIPKTSIGENGFISMFTDTEGNTIGLHSSV